jgi:hypothetical protein
MRGLSFVGTLAMFLVGGGIFSHSISVLKSWSARLTAKLANVQGVGGVLEVLSAPLFDALVGLAVGAVSVGLITGAKRIVPHKPAES